MEMQQELSEEGIFRIGMFMRMETWRNFRIDFSGSILYALFNVVFNQFYVPMAIRHGASNVDVGLLTAAPAIGMLLSPLWASFIGTKSPKPYVLWPLTVARLSLAVVGFVLTPWMFVAMSFFINFLNGVQAPAYPALLSRIYPPTLRGRLMGYVRVAQGFLLIPIAYVIGRWIEISGDRWPLVIAAITGTISVIVFCRVREVEVAPQPEQTITVEVTPPSTWKTNIRNQWLMVKNNRALAVFLVATTATGFGNLLAGPIYQIYQVHLLNLNSGQLGVTRVLYYISLLIAYFLLGWVIDKFSPKRAMIIGIAGYTLSPLLYILLGTYGGVMISYLLLGIGDAAWDIGCMAYIFKVTPGKEATAFGLHYLLFGIRGSIAPIVSTAATHVVSLQTIFLASTLIGAIGLALILLPDRKKASPST